MKDHPAIALDRWGESWIGYNQSRSRSRASASRAGRRREPSRGVLRPLGDALEASWAVLGPSWRPLGPFTEFANSRRFRDTLLGLYFGAPRAVPRSSWGALGRSSALGGCLESICGPSWGPLQALSGRCGKGNPSLDIFMKISNFARKVERCEKSRRRKVEK